MDIGPTPQPMRLTAGLSFLTFPPMLLAGFGAHPNLVRMEQVTDVATWVARFHGNFWFHAGHLLVMFSVLPIAVVGVYQMARLYGTRGQSWGLIGGAVGLFGAFILSVDKGALTLPLTAFDTLPADQFAAIAPALQAILERRGALILVYLLPALPLGFAAASVGMLRARLIPRWQGGAQIVGLLLLVNPDIEIISVAGSALMCAGYLPVGWKLMKRDLTAE
jgi:hypothetical protein